MFSKKLLIPLLSLSLLVTPAYSSHAAENTEAAYRNRGWICRRNGIPGRYFKFYKEKVES